MISTLISTILLGPALVAPVEVDGDGYLRFVREGRIVYAKSSLLVVQDGLLADRKGPVLAPRIHVPQDALSLTVDLDGTIRAATRSGTNAIGRLVLASIAMKPAEDHGFFVTVAKATLGSPGEGGLGVIRGLQSRAQTTSAGPVTIKLLAEVEIEGDSITIASCADLRSIRKDLAKRLESITIGQAPPAGIVTLISATRAKAAIARAHLSDEVAIEGTGTTVRRKSQALKQDAFISVAIKAAQEKLGAEIPLVCTDSVGDFAAPAGKVELRPENVVKSGSAVSVYVAVYVDGARINSRTVNLKPEDGAKGIAVGTTVKVLIKSSGITVEAPGRARTAGWIGQTITVVMDTGSVVTGIVIGPDKVEVKL